MLKYISCLTGKADKDKAKKKDAINILTSVKSFFCLIMSVNGTLIKTM